jgi:hypothetical protein
VLLNNDTEVLSPDWVQSLVKVAASDAKVAAVGCKMVSMGQPDRLDSVGGMGIPFWRGFVDIGREERDEGQYDTADFDPFSFCGGAALLRKAVFEEVGGFDREFFMYLEDVDLSWRLRLFGYRIGFAPDVVVAHAFSGIAGVGQSCLVEDLVDCCVSYGLLGAVAEVSLDAAWFPVSCSSQLEDDPAVGCGVRWIVYGLRDLTFRPSDLCFP